MNPVSTQPITKSSKSTESSTKSQQQQQKPHHKRAPSNRSTKGGDSGRQQQRQPQQQPQQRQQTVSATVFQEAKQDPMVSTLLEKTGVKWQEVPFRPDRTRLCSGSDSRLYELSSEDRIPTNLTPRGSEMVLKRIEPQTSVLSSFTDQFEPMECYYAETPQDVYDAFDEMGTNSREAKVTQIAITDSGIYSDNALNEVLVNAVLQHLLTNSVTPHILHVKDLYYHPRDGASMCMERFDYNLDEFAGYKKNWWTLEKMGSLVFQVLHALYVLQTTVQFKHHDLHDQNVALVRITDDMVFRGQHLRSASHFVYTVDDVTYYVPNFGYIVKVIDMGFASVTVGGRRMQRVDLNHFNDKPSTYGYWDAQFDGKRSYDVQVLLSKFMTPTFHSLCKKNRDMKQFMEVLYFTALGEHGKNSPKQRPLTVNDDPASVLIHKIFGAPQPNKKKNSGVSFVTPPPPPTPPPPRDDDGKPTSSTSPPNSSTLTYNALADFSTPNLAEVQATYQRFYHL